mmetsp:Transcript_14953/g.23824  ORF Transcript_14953/g.23824 Transcript_14953/m.23824 type:complete len:89 (+) Transcript_14953:4211-4477(+)
MLSPKKLHVKRILYVRNLPVDVSLEELVTLFERFGEIYQIRIGIQKETHGTAFIIFKNFYDKNFVSNNISGLTVRNKYIIVLIFFVTI